MRFIGFSTTKEKSLEEMAKDKKVPGIKLLGQEGAFVRRLRIDRG